MNNDETRKKFKKFESGVIKELDSYKDVEMSLIDVTMVISVALMKLGCNDDLQTKEAQSLLSVVNIILTKELTEWAKMQSKEKVGGGNA